MGLRSQTPDAQNIFCADNALRNSEYIYTQRIINLLDSSSNWRTPPWSYPAGSSHVLSVWMWQGRILMWSIKKVIDLPQSIQLGCYLMIYLMITMSQTNKTYAECNVFSTSPALSLSNRGLFSWTRCVFWTGLWMLKFASKDQRSTTLFVGNGNVVDCWAAVLVKAQQH